MHLHGLATLTNFLEGGPLAKAVPGAAAAADSRLHLAASSFTIIETCLFRKAFPVFRDDGGMARTAGDHRYSHTQVVPHSEQSDQEPNPLAAEPEVN